MKPEMMEEDEKGMAVMKFEVGKNQVPMSTIHVPVNSSTEYKVGDSCKVEVVGKIKGLMKDDGFDRIMACIEFPDKEVELKNISKEDEEEADKMNIKGMKGVAEIRDLRAKAKMTERERY